MPKAHDLSFSAGSRLSTRRIGKNLKKGLKERDRTAILQAKEEILAHMHGRGKDRQKLKEALAGNDFSQFYMTVKGWLPESPSGEFKSDPA